VFGWACEEFVGIGWLSDSESTRDTPDFLPIVFVPFDEFGRKIESLPNGDLKRRDAIVVVDEVGGDPCAVKVKVRVFARLHGNVRAVFGVVDAHAHCCSVSLPSNFANLDSGHKAGDDFSKGFGGDVVVGSEGGEDGVGRHGRVFVENDGRGMILFGSPGRRRTVAWGGDGVVDAVIGHVPNSVVEE